MRILVTGSSGLVGGALAEALEQRGHEVVRLDLRAEAMGDRGDVRDADLVARKVRGCSGLVHLAAVSRVVWGEQDPDACWRTNVGGTETVLQAASGLPHRPWAIFASSREVYGQSDHLPVAEDAPLRPMNVYADTKVAGERLFGAYADTGASSAVVRLSNVYGRLTDHRDRVLMAFAASAARGETLRIDGGEHTFDFTHIDDTTRGLLSVVELLDSGGRPPPIHLLTGTGTTLARAAALAVDLGGGRARTIEAPARTYDVAHFVGDPRRAEALLGFRAQISLRTGLGRLISDFQKMESLS